MMPQTSIPLDCLIFGGGVAGLFALDTCVSMGQRVLLLECNTLGSGQTIHSHGLIHGDLTSTSTMSTSTSMEIRDIPLIWQRYLSGESLPDLQNVTMRSEYCHVWSNGSKLASLGWRCSQVRTRNNLQVLDREEYPPAFHGCRGTVARLHKQVIDPRSLLEVLSHKHAHRLLQTTKGSVEIIQTNRSWLIRLLNPDTGEPLDLSPKKIIFTAGRGNQELREMFGLPNLKLKVTHQHLGMIKGDIPIVNGFCIDSMRSQLTITTTTDYARRRVWLIQSEHTKNRPHLTPEQFMLQIVGELKIALPSISLDSMEFRSFIATRVDHRKSMFHRADIVLLEDGDILTCWPTEMSFAPRLAHEIARRICTPTPSTPSHDGESMDAEQNVLHTNDMELLAVAKWPRPQVTLPPWETDQIWMRIASS